MSNTHGIADFAHELQAVCADQLPACILAQTGLAVPAPPGLTLPAFSTEGYVRETDTLVYVEQDAHTVTLTGADGTFWLALATDTWTAYAQWTTEAGSHYRWRPNATQPADVAGLLTFASVTVAGGAITAVTPLPTVTSQAMSKQLSGAVAITGGTAVLGTLTATVTAQLGGNVGLGTPPVAPYVAVFAAGKAIMQAGASLGIEVDPAYPLDVGGRARIQGSLGLGTPPATTNRLSALFDKNTTSCLVLQALAGTDGGGQFTQAFLNGAGTVVGSITQSASATGFNTSSDVRLKKNVALLLGGLDAIRALRPVSFRWQADDSPGVGFLAHEVQAIAPEAVTGEQDAVDAAGQILPQGLDLSKLVPYLVGACQELAQQVDALTVRLAALEGA